MLIEDNTFIDLTYTLNNNNNITNIQKNNSKEEKINLNSDSVNSNNFMRDLNLQRIKE